MEMKIYKRCMRTLKNIMLLSIVSITCACSNSEKEDQSVFCINSSEHTLLALSPDFTIKAKGDSLNENYLSLKTGQMFPLIGILKVDGKAYRFLGGDSLRISSLVPLSNDSLGWSAKYSFLFPGKGWEMKEYDDSSWSECQGAMGSMNVDYPTHTVWGANNIYVRRYFNIDNKDALQDHKVYVRYICDDQIKLYCNGESLLESKTRLSQTDCQRLVEKDISHIVKGENVFAVHGYNKGGIALLDFGLYVENRTYSDAEPAILKKMDVQATQTHYAFQCGSVELRIDFVSPALSGKWNMTGWPVGFISYQINTNDEEEHDVEILFDVDTEWMFGCNHKTISSTEHNWRLVKSDSLYLGIQEKASAFSYDSGHTILSQKLDVGNKNKGVLVIGYKEEQALQYSGEILRPCWNKSGTVEFKELLKSVGNRYPDFISDCDKLDNMLNIKAFQKGEEEYAERMLPSFRNFVSSHRFVLSSNNLLFCFNDSLGNVREAYNSFPILQFFNRIDWMKGLLNPIFEYCEDVNWKKRFPPYDIGLYPITSKQAKTEECAVEAAANMLLMTLAIVEAERDVSYADSHWKLLFTWGSYLQERMSKGIFSSEELLNESGEREKCAMGLKAYQKLIQYRKGND